MPAIWKYPPEIMAKLQKPLPEEVRAKSDAALRKRHAETLERINSRIAAEAALAKEKALALAWCRANGNPHLNGE